jgi:hypothetical protein
MKKQNRANKELKEKRLDMVLDLMIKHRSSNRKIRKVLMQSEGISRRTADRYIEEVRKTLAAIGSQASDEERGLLWERIEDLYFHARSSPSPNLSLLNQIVRTQLAIHITNPDKKGAKKYESDFASKPTLSPELESAFKRLGVFGPDEGSKDFSTGS